jgi:hypothetical protein
MFLPISVLNEIAAVPFERFFFFLFCLFTIKNETILPSTFVLKKLPNYFNRVLPFYSVVPFACDQKMFVLITVIVCNVQGYKIKI